jgi:hypothetical protein
MAQLVISNSALLTVEWSSVAGTWSNVIGLTGSPVMPPVDQTLANGIHSDFATALNASGLLPLLSSVVTFERVKLRDISGPARPEFESAGTPISGTGTGDVLPLSVCAVLTLRTGVASKSGRGRIYFSGFSEAENDATGRALPAVNVAIKALIDNFGTPLAARQLAVAVLSRPAASITIPAKTTLARTGQANRLTATVARNTKWESQRRRTGRL